MRYSIGFFGGAAVMLAIVLSCSSPQNPYNDADRAGIDEVRSLNLGDTLTVGTTYSCTVETVIPRFIDSFAVHAHAGSKDTVIATGTLDSSGLIVFPFTVAHTGAHSLEVVVFKQPSGSDTLVREFEAGIPEELTFFVKDSFRPRTDTLTLGEEVQCTVTVQRDHLLDSFSMFTIQGPQVSPVVEEAVSGPRIEIPFTAAHTGYFELLLVVHSVAGTSDSLSRFFVGYAESAAPELVADSTAYRVFAGDSVTVSFTASDVDGDLFEWELQADTAQPVGAKFGDGDHGAANISHAVAYASFDTVAVIAAVQDSQFQSAQAACTVFVLDTLPPRIELVAPADTAALVTQLPLRIAAVVHDESPVDSIKFNDTHMIDTSDTAVLQASLQPGEFLYTIAAWDRAGNKGGVAFNLHYDGDSTYPPQIKNLSSEVAEGASFDTLLLDTCVVITDPDPEYAVDSLQWVISESNPGGGLEVVYNAAQRTLAIAPPHSEWWGSEVVTLVAIAPDGMSGNAEATFRVTAVNDPPQLLLRDSYLKLKGAVFDTLDLDTCASDTDNTVSQLSWTFRSGKYFQVRRLGIELRLDPDLGDGYRLPKAAASNQVVIEPKTYLGTPVIDEDTWTGTDTLIFSVSDPEGEVAEKEVLFTKYELYVPPLKY